MATKLYKISEVAREVGVLVSKVKYYQSLDLISSAGRTQGGHHLFTQASIERLKLILKLRSEGLSLQEVKTKLKEMGLISNA